MSEPDDAGAEHETPVDVLERLAEIEADLASTDQEPSS